MNSLSFRFDGAEISVDLFDGENCVDSIPVSLDDAISLHQQLDDVIAQARRAANDDSRDGK